MEIIIKKVYEYMNQLRVEVEHDYGTDNLGLSIEAKYLDPETGEPRWKREVKDLMELKYGSRDKNNKILKKNVFKDHIGTKFVVGETK